jgi:hypothetical protein
MAKKVLQKAAARLVQQATLHTDLVIETFIRGK